MRKTVIAALFCASLLHSNDLVDALKGKKSSPPTIVPPMQTQITPMSAQTPRPSRQLCDPALIAAIEKNDVSFFENLKGRLKESNECADADDLNPLMMASYTDRTKIARLYIKEGVDVNKKNRNDYTALHFASFYGNFEIVSMLLDSGANVNALTNAGQTPLMIASYYGNAKTAKIMLSKGADPHIKDFAGHNAKELAQKKQKKEVLAVMKEGKL